MIFFDTETCGFHGPIVLLQYAMDDGPVHLYSPWSNPIYRTLEIIDTIVESDVCGFNLAFDWFHLCQMYTTLTMFDDFGKEPICHIDEYAQYEKEARDLDICLKPKRALDLMLLAQAGEFQGTMNRKPIRVNRVPNQIAETLREELETIEIPEIYFSKKVDSERWKVLPNGRPGFSNIKIEFAPSSALKAIIAQIQGISVTKIDDIMPSRNPFEIGYAPYALAPFYEDDILKQPSPKNWWHKWPDFIQMHHEHWAHHPLARKYAENDVHYTRFLYEYFKKPEPGDKASELACLVGALRWRGLNVDTKALENRLNSIETTGHNFNSNRVCEWYLSEVLTPVEKTFLIDSDGKFHTPAPLLEEIATWGTEASERARHILEYRRKLKEKELYGKLITADRFHANFKVIGALSNRMSGDGGLNAQGINHSKEIRSCFPLAWPGMQLAGGDFEGSQVAIACAVYKDDKMTSDLKSGKKIYAIFGETLFPDETYDSIMKSKGKPGELDKYDRSKKGFLAMLFGGEAYTLSNRVGISQEAAEEGVRRFLERYKQWGQERRRYASMFCSMTQPNGIGTQVIWKDSADYIESMFGFRRYFVIENLICKKFYELANKPPKDWHKIKGYVKRRDSEQTVLGATQSALYGAAFQIQAANMRAASNHVIQSPEADMVKDLQNRIWQLQPSGVHPWHVMPINIHDEVMAPCKPHLVSSIRSIVESFVEEMRTLIPLMGISWDDDLPSWAGKIK
jgi:hypothetical protein